MRKLVVLTLVCAQPLYADAEWRSLSGEAVRDALSGKRVQYARAWQHFYASGRTLYNAGQDSWGYWRIEDDRYCSMWPPSDLWACYDVQGATTAVRFVGEGGEITAGVYIDD